MINSITLLGSSPGRNAGDAALVGSIMDAVDSKCNKRILYEIPTIKPRFIRENYSNNTKSISMMPWSLSIKMLGLPTYNSILRTDLSLIFDAVLFDRSLYNPLFNYLSTLALLLPAAKKKGKKIALYDVGIGPIKTQAGQNMLKKIIELSEFITVRDKASYDLLLDSGAPISRTLITADAALNFTPCSADRSEKILNDLGFKKEDEILALNVSKYLDTWSGKKDNFLSRSEFIQTFSDGVNSFLKKYDLPVLFVVTQHHDFDLTGEILSKIESKNHCTIFSNTEYSPSDVCGVLGKVSMLFAMRLHATILAASMNTPVTALPHQPKVSYFFATLGLEDQILNFNNFSSSRICEHLETNWNNRNILRKKITTALPLQKQKAAIAAELVSAMDKGLDIETEILKYSTETKISHAL